MKYLLVLVLLFVGCTQTVAPSTSPPSAPPTASSTDPTASNPSPICSPMGGTPAPCTQQEYEKTQEQNRLTEEAIALYRRWTKESTRLYRAGGTSEPTPEMLATTAGKFQGSVLGIFQDLKAARARAVSGEVKIATIEPDLNADVEPGTTAITACLDARSLRLQRDGQTIKRGTLAIEDVVAKQVDGQLRLWSARSAEVKSC